MNKLTIVTVSYNQEEYIAQTLESFVMQKTNFQFEVIIADDCSTDSTAKIIKDYADKYPDIIKPMFREKNLGSVKNYIDTLARVKSEYVIVNDGDDYFSDPLKLQKQVDFLDSHLDFSMCFHLVTVKYDDGSKPDEIFPTPEFRMKKKTFALEDLLDKNFMQTNSVMYRWRFNKGENIKEIFPKDIMPCDWFLHILHAQTGKIAFIDEDMAVYRRHPGGIWWESTNGADALHIKHGQKELNFYLAVEKQLPDRQEKCHQTTIQVTKSFLNIYLKHRMFDKVEKLLDLCPDCVENESFGSNIFYIEEKIEKYKKRYSILLIISIVLFVLLLGCIVTSSIPSFLH